MSSGGDPTKGTLARKAKFQQAYGAFPIQWASIQLIMDAVIGHLLNLDAKSAHLMTAGLEVNRKVTILRGIIRHVKHPQQAELLRSLSVIQNESKRNVFAHSYWVANSEEVIFIERSSYNGELTVKTHAFTLKQFQQHVAKIEAAAQNFERALGHSRDKVVEFAKALGVALR